MRILARFLVYGALVVSIAAGAVLWWAGTPHSMSWAVAQAERVGAGSIEIDGAGGSLAAGGRAARMVWRTKDVRVSATDVELAWSPLHLLSGRLVISRLTAGRLDIQLHPGGETQARSGPLELPALPLAVEIIEAGVDTLSVEVNGTVRHFPGVDLRLAADRRAWHLDLHRVESPWGTVQARLEFGGAAPFRLTGTGVWFAHDGTQIIPVNVRAHGTLEEFAMELAASVRRADFAATVRVAPRHEHPVRHASMRVARFDPARWLPGSPGADVHGEIALDATPGGSLAGRAAFDNRDRGALDRGRIPLARATASATVSADDGVARLDDLVLDTGTAGRIVGQAEWRAGTVRLDAAVQQLDLRGLHAGLIATALDGQITVSGDAAMQRVTVSAAQDGHAIELGAALSPAGVVVEHARLRAGDSRFEGSGRLDLAGTRPYRVEGVLSGFDPSRWGDYPSASLHAEIDATGALSPELEARLRFRLRDSSLLGHPLSGEGDLEVAGTRVEHANATLSMAGNTLELDGVLGAADQRLRWRMTAPHLDRLDAGVAGSLRAQGHLAGTLDALELGFELDAQGLHVGGAHRIERLRAGGEWVPGVAGTVAAKVELDGYTGPAGAIRRAQAAAHGTPGDHSITLTAEGDNLGLEARGVGAWDAAGWQGLLTHLVNDRGPLAARLAAPARVRIARGSYALHDAALDLAAGRVQITRLEHHDDRLDLEGSAGAIPVRWLLAQAGLQAAPVMDGDLALAAQWSLSIDEHLNGALRVWREAGDLEIATKPPVPLDLQRAELAIEVVDNRVTVRTELDSTRLLRASMRAEGELSRRGARWGMAGDAPLALTGTVAMDSLAWLGLVAPPPGLDTEGSLRAGFSVAGTLRVPEMGGHLVGSGLRVHWPEHGLDLGDGVIEAAFDGERIVISRIGVRGGKGTLEATGEVTLGAEPRARVTGEASRLQLISAPDRLLIVSGTTDLEFDGEQATVRSRLVADRAAFELPPAGITMSDDVVVVGAEPPGPPARPRLPLHAEVEFDFGPDFALRGSGLDVRLAGLLRLVAADAKPPAAHGTVRVVKGTYSAYGQTLTVERGGLNFSGAIDDPQLDILALRKGLKVEAGVEVGGTLLAPRIRLVSRPDVSDAEKLSWLVFGRGLDKSSRGEVGMLSAAAGALLASGQSASLQAQLAQAGGLDEFAVTGGGEGLADTIVTFGKRLSSRVYVSYEQGLAEATSAFKVHYEFSRRWSARAQTGTANALDLFYTLEFD
jgi:translocation and assembly module TamB